MDALHVALMVATFVAVGWAWRERRNRKNPEGGAGGSTGGDQEN